MVIQLVLALLIVTSFVACYFTSKSWHWAQVLLVEVLFLTGLGYFILAGEVLRVKAIYGAKEQQLAKQIDRIAPQVEALTTGTRDPGVIAQLEAEDLRLAFDPNVEEGEPQKMLSRPTIDHQLGLVTRTRGHVWRDVFDAGFDQATLTVSLKIEKPNPHGIEVDAILYAFEQGPAASLGRAGASYIGEFRVLSVTAQQVQIQPTTDFDARSINRLAKTTFPWVLYENLPIDQHPDGLLGLFAGATEKELRKMLPPRSVEEYIRHGSPARPDDDEWHRTGYDENGQVVGVDDWDATTQFKYRRMLRDYNVIFQELFKRFTELKADRLALVEDNKILQESLVSARELEKMRKDDQRQLKADLEGFEKDRRAIETHLAQVETQLANAVTLLKATRIKNAQLAKILEASAPK